MEPSSVNRDTRAPEATPSWGALLLLALAFGVIEGLLVVELRVLLDPDGTSFPLVSFPETLLNVERAREAATLLLLAASAALAASGWVQRFATFLFLFGAWDLVYYVTLRTVTGWPHDPMQWDLLFLLPVAWLGPVYAPVAISVVMLGVGFVTLRNSGRFAVRARHVAAAIVGGAFCIWSFTFDADARALVAIPDRYRWELLIAGILLAAAGYVDAWRHARSSPG
jgi:hypothetical protein